MSTHQSRKGCLSVFAFFSLLVAMLLLWRNGIISVWDKSGTVASVAANYYNHTEPLYQLGGGLFIRFGIDGEGEIRLNCSDGSVIDTGYIDFGYVHLSIDGKCNEVPQNRS